MKSSIKIDFTEVTGRGLQPVIAIRLEKSDDPRDGLLQTFFQQLGGQSNWLQVSFDHHIQSTDGRENKSFISVLPVRPEQMEPVMNEIKSRIEAWSPDPEKYQKQNHTPFLP